MTNNNYLSKPIDQNSESFRNNIFNSNSVNEYYPIVNSDDRIAIYEVLPLLSDSKNTNHLKSFSRNVLLYELRTFLDAMSLLERNPDNNFKIEVPLSYETLEKGFIESELINKERTDLFERLIFCIDYKDNEQQKRYRFIKKNLNKLAGLGFKTMLKTKGGALPFDYFNDEFDYLKITVDMQEPEELDVLIDFIGSFQDKTSVKTILSESCGEKLKSVKLQAAYLLQSYSLEKPRRTLISTKRVIT